MPREDQENSTKMHHQYYMKTKLTQTQDSKSLSKEIFSKRYNNNSNLPLKKRFCITLTETCMKMKKEEDILIESLVQKKQNTQSSEEINKNLQHNGFKRLI